MNNSVYEQIFRTQSVSDDVLCLELRTRKPSTSWNDKLGVSASAVFVEEWSSGKNLPLTPSTLLHTTFHLRRQLSSTPLSTYAVNSPPHHLPLPPSTILHTTFHLRRQLSSTPPSTYAINSPPHHLPLPPSTLLHTTFHLRRQLSSSRPSTYAVNSPPHHLPLPLSTLLHTTFHLRRQLSSSPPSTSAVNSPPYRYGKTNVSFRLYFICSVLCLSFL